MKIESSHYLSGIPANEDYKIHLTNGLILNLTPEEYKDLCCTIGDKNAEDINSIESSIYKFYQRAEKFQALIDDLRNLFYHGDEDGDILFRTELKDIDEEKLYDILDKHKGKLGLE